MKKLIHWIAHQFGANEGHVYSWWDGDKLMIGFRCVGCDCMSGIHEVRGLADKPQEGE